MRTSHVVEAGRSERGAQIVCDLAHRRASRIGGRDGRHHPMPVDADAAQDPEVGDGEHRDLGVHRPAKPTAQARRGPARRWPSPFQPRMTALHPLHLGQERPEMLGMEATPSPAALIWIVGNLKVGLVQDLPDDLLARCRDTPKPHLRTTRRCTATGRRPRLAHVDAIPRCRRRAVSPKTMSGGGDSGPP